MSLLIAGSAPAQTVDDPQLLLGYRQLRGQQIAAHAWPADHRQAARRTDAHVAGNPGNEPVAPGTDTTDRSYWRTEEFAADWGLGVINADAAYARGLSGQGIRLGVFDGGSGLDHGEFAGKNHRSLRIADLLADGSRCTNTTYLAGPKACFASDGDQVAIGLIDYDPSLPEEGRRAIEASPYPKPGAWFQTHGTHVAGTIAANRDGTGMHGVAFGADLTVAKLFFDSALLWKRMQNGYGLVDAGHNGPALSAFADMYAQLDAGGVRAVNHSWGRGQEPETVEQLDAVYASTLQRRRLNTFAAGSRNNGLIQVWAAGNSNALNASPEDAPIAGMYATLPRAFAEIEPYWLAVVNVNQELELSSLSHRCGVAANWCIAAPGTNILSAVYGGDSRLQAGVGFAADGGISVEVAERVPTYSYEWMSGTSMAAPHVTGALGLLMERFPYLDNAQVRDVLLTTATDLGETGVDDVYGWGLVNLAKAIEGYGALRVDTEVVMDQKAGGLKVWEGDAWDDWRNDIDGPGRLTKSGAGWLRLSGSNSFNGATLHAGTLELTGANALADSLDVHAGNFLLAGSLLDTWLKQYGGQSHITMDASMEGGGIELHDGGLVFDGLLTQGEYWQFAGKGRVGTEAIFVESDITLEGGVLSFNGIQDGGVTHVGANATLMGVGTLGSTTVEGTIAPGNSIGTLTIAGDYVQTATGIYRAELAPGSRSDRLNITGNATIEGTLVALPEPGIYYLGEHFDLLRVGGQLTGTFVTADFTAFSPFLKFELLYGANGAAVDVVRGQTLASAVVTPNQRAVAAAADVLAVNQGLPKPLTQLFPEQLPQVMDSLSGELHASTASVLVEDSRYLREALTGRMTGPGSPDPSQDGDTGAWVQALAGSGTLDGNANVARTEADTSGLLVGIDHELGGWRLGVMAGTGRTDIKQAAGRAAKSKIDTTHWGVYAGRGWGGFAVRAGLAFSYHEVDSTRSVNFAGYSSSPRGRHDADTRQAFVEAAYRFGDRDGGLEPYLQVAHVEVQVDGIRELGGAAALRGQVADTRSTVGSAGLRFDKGLKARNQQHAWLHLTGGLGYRHVSGDRSPVARLGWRAGEQAFTVSGAEVSRSAATAELGLSAWLTPRQQLDLRYSGQFGDDSDNNAINARWSIRF